MAKKATKKRVKATSTKADLMSPRSKTKQTAKKKTTTRQLKQVPYRSLRLSKRIKHPGKPLPSAFKLLKTSTRQLFKNWKLFGGITLVYLVLTIILVKGFGSNSNITELKATLQGTAGGGSRITSSFALLGALMSNVNNTDSAVASTYQTMLLIVVSLVLIWALRHTASSKKVVPGIRDAFYKSLYPLVPFILVLLVISLQLIPVLIGNFVYSAVLGGGLAVTPIEKGLWIIFTLILVLISLYMITSSLFALYVVTLPDLRPMAALRSARELVRYRRLNVLRKLLFLPLVLLILASVITIPIIIWSPAVAEWVFFGLSMIALTVFHSYMYNLYRSLL